MAPRVPLSLIEVDCSELTEDEQLALAGAITESLHGTGMAFVKGRKIVLDDLADLPLDEKAVDSAIRHFIGRRKESEWYSIERQGDRVVVRSANPIAAKRRGGLERLPPNLLKCPFCPFVTPYEEAYVVHYRSHGFT